MSLPEPRLWLSSPLGRLEGVEAQNLRLWYNLRFLSRIGGSELVKFAQRLHASLIQMGKKPFPQGKVDDRAKY